VVGWQEIGASLMGAEPARTGSGVLATITFEIIAAPPAAGELSCVLEVVDTGFLDDNLEACELTITHSYYEFAAPKPPLPYLAVDPEFVSAKEVGDEVIIDITVQELVVDWRATGFQWRLGYNTSILETKDEWITEGDFLSQFGESYFFAMQEADYVISFSLQLGSGGEFPPTVFPEGSGTLATIKFNATYKPTIIDMSASCELDLYDMLIVNDDAEPIEIEPEVDGFYQITIAPPPWLSIEPKEHTAAALGEEFDLTVFINNLDADWKMVGAEFKIRYNLTMLELTNITEAGFMKHFADLAGTDTWFQYYVEEDQGYGIVGVLILPIENGTWPGPFPDTTDYGAPGDLATVTFNPIYQDKDVALTSDIYLDDIILATSEATSIPYDQAKTTEEGICKYTIKRAIEVPELEVGVDLYTQYSEPYGGQGQGYRSDAFAPQTEVDLFAFATYRDEGVPGKPVAYTIYNPLGEVIVVRTAFTDPNGIALLNYRIPHMWTGDASEVFGDWTVVATVPIADVVYTDTLKFEVGWIVTSYQANGFGVGPDYMQIEPEMVPTDWIFGREVPVALTLKFKSILMQLHSADVVVTVLDELGQPLAKINATISFSGEGYENGLLNNETARQWNEIEIMFEMPSWAFLSADAAICVNIFTTDVPMAPEVVYLFGIGRTG